MIWFLLFLAVLGIAWFLFVPRTGDETTLPLDGDRQDTDLPNVSAHATSNVEPTLTHPAALFTADGTDMPTAPAEAGQDGGGQFTAGQDAGERAAAVQGAPEPTYAGQDAAHSAAHAAQEAAPDAVQNAARKTAELGWMPDNYQEPRLDAPPGNFE